MGIVVGTVGSSYILNGHFEVVDSVCTESFLKEFFVVCVIYVLQ